MPELVEGAGWPYVALGCGYALAAATMFALGAGRRRALDSARAAGAYANLPAEWAVMHSAAGGCLAVATLAVVIFA